MSGWSEGWHEEEVRDPKAVKLSKRGLAMLLEIYEAGGRQGIEPDTGCGPDVALDKLASHQDEANKKGVAQVRRRLIDGGYLAWTDRTHDDDTRSGEAWNIVRVNLAPAAYAALKEFDAARRR